MFFILWYVKQNPGQLKIYSGGILWKKQGGGKAIEVDKADIVGVTWMKVPKTNQLGVRIKDGLFYKFIGFRDQVSVQSTLSVLYIYIYWLKFYDWIEHLQRLFHLYSFSMFLFNIYRDKFYGNMSN